MDSDTPPIRILIADDHQLLLDGISALLRSFTGVELVGQASDGQQALQQFIALQPDITLMDLQMPVLNGLDAITAIRALQPQARIIVLTTYKGDSLALRAIHAGACGYLLKSSLRHELLAAIQNVHAGRRHITPEIEAELALYACTDVLSKRELDVLRLVAQGNANRETGRLLNIKEETVKAHMSTVLAKLGARDRTHAVTIALQRGILGTL
ncbi:response regulator transcription factor [Janthinobacterium lividum]|uniref:response regulator transcription factor n=1 Tax=Janthinobacterium lividum TaxID=29581 RepID=UPI00140BE6D8|nr:response regulator transcription factor [Janthinobacterium lividum]NHQ93226.1 response regulator transcription factor [Janthinobacterium lividum]